MIEVPQHRLEGHVGDHPAVGSQEGGGEIQPDHAVAVGDDAKLFVSQVAGVWANGVGIGMGCHQRCRR